MLNDIAQFILYLVPGFLAVMLHNLFVPTRKPSDFELTAQSLIVSLLIFTPLRLLEKKLGIPLTQSKSLYLTCSWLLAILAGIVWPSVQKSSIYAKILHIFNINYSWRVNVWNSILDHADHAPWVIVSLQNKEEYLGQVIEYTLDPNDPSKEVFLKPAYRIVRNGNIDEEPQFESLRLGVFIAGQSICAIRFIEEQELVDGENLDSDKTSVGTS